MPKRVSSYRGLAYGLLASTALTSALIMPDPARAQALSTGPSMAAGLIDDETFAIGDGPDRRPGARRVPDDETSTIPATQGPVLAGPGGHAGAVGPGSGPHAAPDPPAGAVLQSGGPAGSLIDALSQSIATLIGGGDDTVMVSGSRETSETRAPVRTRATAPGGPGGGLAGAGQATGRMRVPLRAAVSAEAPGPSIAGVPVSIEGAAAATPGRIDVGRAAGGQEVAQARVPAATPSIDLHGMDGTGGCFDVRRPEPYADGEDEAIGTGSVLKGALRSPAREAGASPAGDVLWVAGGINDPGGAATAAVAKTGATTLPDAPGGGPASREGDHLASPSRSPPAGLAETRSVPGRPPQRPPEPAGLTRSTDPVGPRDRPGPLPAVAVAVSTPPASPPKPATGVATVSGDRRMAGSSDGVSPRPPAEAPLLVGSSAGTSGAPDAGTLTATLPGGYGVAFIAASGATAARSPIVVSASAGSIAVTTAVAGPTILIAANSYAGTSPVGMVAVLAVDPADMADGSTGPLPFHVIGGGTLVATAGGVASLPPPAVKPDSPDSPIPVRMLALTGPGRLGGTPVAGLLPDTGAPRYSSSADQTLSGVISEGGMVVADPGMAATLPSADADGGCGPIQARMLALAGSGTLGPEAPGFDEAPVGLVATVLPEGAGLDRPGRIEAVAVNDL